MLNGLKLILALAIVSGSYLFTFGMPEQIAPLLPGTETTEQDKGDGQPSKRSTARASSAVLEPLILTPYTATIQSIGTATAWKSAEVAAETTGRITEVLIQANTEISAGSELVRLDNQTETLNVQVAKAQLGQASSLVARYREIKKQGIASISDAELDEAILAVTEAELAVNLATVALADKTIVAPISGRLGLSNVTVGNLVQDSDIVVTIDDTSKLIVKF